jgi:5,10-methylene-tetrahydrofolate dehydrogenase/methenyl tetrahydrofolate cyclohydrolase
MVIGPTPPGTGVIQLATFSADSKSLNARATVTICHSKTQDLPNKLKQADIVVTAVGIAQMIQGEWIKQGAIVIN